MSIASDIAIKFPQGTFQDISVDKDTRKNGQKAVEVTATLTDGRTVTGTFLTEQKASFGGVEFNSIYNVANLMTAKINSVLNGTHDRT